MCARAGSDHEAAIRLLKESSRRQSHLNESLKLALGVISELEQASGARAA